MRKLLLLSLLNLIFSSPLPAQSQQPHNIIPKARYEYYITLSGLTGRQEVETLQTNIARKEGIKFFMANRFPVRYFLMESERLVPVTEFEHWISRSYQVTLYGEGNKAREQAIVLYNKSKAR